MDVAFTRIDDKGIKNRVSYDIKIKIPLLWKKEPFFYKAQKSVGNESN